jgi:hypothetical protein
MISYEVITFSSTTAMTGLDLATLSSAEGKLAFAAATAKSMTSVRTRDVNIMSVIETSGPPEDRKLGRTHKFITEYIVTDCAVIWNVSVALTRLGTTNGSIAYTSMTSELSTSMSSGEFVAIMKSQTTMFSNLTSGSITIDGYAVVTAFKVTQAPTSAPTVTAVVPSVYQMEISQYTRTTLTLSVTLIKTRVVERDVTNGYLFCVAMVNGSAPSSIGSIKALSLSDDPSMRGILKDYPIGSAFPLSSSVTFEGLVALQAYAIYCYVETSLGTGSLLSEVLRTRIVQTTACCKTLTFTNSPVFIFGDVRKYIASGLKSTYIFEYSLSSAPLKSLQVTPVFSLNGLVSTDVVATPSNSNFTSKSQLTGQFFLSASSEISGSYSISLTASGSSTAQYTNGVSTLVQILSTFSPIPAPMITSCRFSDSGQAVVITFDSLTDQAGIIAASWSCSLLFTFTGASGTTCSWVSTNAVSVSFGVVTNITSDTLYLSIGESVKLKKGLLKAFCLGTVSFCASNPVASAMSVITLAPLKPSIPTGSYISHTKT